MKAWKFTHPMKYTGSYDSGYWAGYKFKEALGYTTGRHTGVDYNWGSGHDDRGFACHSIANGVVVAKGSKSGFGNYVIIRHELDARLAKQHDAKKYAYSRYLHLQNVTVKKGQEVKVGTAIAQVGDSGTKWAHLHLDLWTDKNGLGPHTDYHKDTQLDSYLDPYKIIEANKNNEETDMFQGRSAQMWAAMYGKEKKTSGETERKLQLTIASQKEQLAKLEDQISGLNAQVKELSKRPTKKQLSEAKDEGAKSLVERIWSIIFRK